MTRYLFIVAPRRVCSSTAWGRRQPGAAATATSRPLRSRLIRCPPNTLIGPEDVLDISVWKNPELSRKVPVRPDGKVSLPLVNDIQAAGLTPSELREQLAKKLAEFVPTPEVAVIVSRSAEPARWRSSARSRRRAASC